MEMNWRNRTLFHGDNLGFLRAMNSESVDLIATDPPFNKGRDFHATPDSLARGAKFQDRWSWKRDVHEEWSDQIRDDYPRLMEAIESARYAHSDGMGAFMCFMAVRLLEMRRVLKLTGSIYLHCDPTASHYLKAVMDAIFGADRFRSDISWKRTSAHNDTKQGRRQHGRIHDVLLYYTRGKKWTWNPVYTEYDQQYAEAFYRYVDGSTGRRYRKGDLTAAKPGGDTRYEWRVKRPLGGQWQADLDNEWLSPLHPAWEYRGVLPYKNRYWAYSREKMRDLALQDRLIYAKTGMPSYKRYLDEMLGVLLQDMWTDIKPVGPRARERTGYPTQKPLELYERIIRASSNEGDMVLDPFAGCATTLVAAERLGRQWIGMDIWHNAKAVVLDRMAKERLALPEADRGDLFAETIHFTAKAPERTDAGEIAAPFLRTPKKRKRPPLAAWQKLSRAQIREELTEAQSINTGLVLCAGCGRELEAPFMELDHIQPRADRGENDISNRILLCRPCNGRKGAKLTMTGLVDENKRAGWTRDAELAVHARNLAQDRYQDIRDGRRRLVGDTEPDLFDRRRR